MWGKGCRLEEHFGPRGTVLLWRARFVGSGNSFGVWFRLSGLGFSNAGLISFWTKDTCLGQRPSKTHGPGGKSENSRPRRILNLSALRSGLSQKV